jgi:two-component system, LuxR family, sensor kinase FixL
MNWITVICSMIAAACLTVASVHLLVWLRARDAWTNLLLSNCAISAAVIVGFDVAMMHAQTPGQYAAILRWIHVPLSWGLVSVVFFARQYLGVGRTWLMWSAFGMRAISLALDFALPVNLYFREISSIASVSILGESISVPLGVTNPWMLLGNASAMLFLVYLVDASVLAWRRGRRREALVIGGVLTPTIFVVVIYAMLFVWGGPRFRTPYLISLAPLGVLLAMSIALSSDLLRTAALARELRESRERMSLAATAAHLGFWEWDVVRDEIWATGDARTQLELDESKGVSFQGFLESLHPDDREPVRRTFLHALSAGDEYEIEYRVLAENEGSRRIAGRGRVELDARNTPLRVRGVAVDVTDRRNAEHALREAYAELDRVSRLTAMGEFAAALAHEILQPLTAIVLDAKSCLRALPETTPRSQDIRAGLQSVIEAGQRAAQVIHRNRELFRHQTVRSTPVDINAVIEEARTLAARRLADSVVTTTVALDEHLPAISGDRVELQQVLLNLIANAIDATESRPAKRIWIRSSEDAGGVRVEVGDNGIGLGSVDMQRMFSLSYTTKPNGTGVGLSVSRAIVDAHGGRIWAESNPEGGASFYFTLPPKSRVDTPPGGLPSRDPLSTKVAL